MTRTIPSLDGLRAISIAMVLIGHNGGAFARFVPGIAGLLPFIGNGGLGVSIFFVISGYLITTLLCAETNAVGRVNLARFYVRRAFRILPAFYVYLVTLGLLGVAGIIAVASRDLLTAGTFVWNYTWPRSTMHELWWVGHSWSLSVEEQFYLLWPLTLVFVGARRARWAALLIIALSPAVRVASYLLWPSERAHIGIMLHTRADTLMFGCAAALWAGTVHFERFCERIQRRPLMVGAALFLGFVVPVLSMKFRGAYVLTVGYTLEGAAILITLLYVVRRPSGRAGAILNSRPFVWVGVMSYSLYLWQQLFSASWVPFGSVVFPANLLVIATAALASYYGVEQPFLRLRRRVEDTIWSDRTLTVPSADGGVLARGAGIPPDGSLAGIRPTASPATPHA